MAKKETAIPLADFVLNTAEELRRIRAVAPPQGEAVIELNQCEIEVNVVVKAEAGGGFKIWVLSAEAKGSVEQATKVTLKFSVPGGIQAFAGAKGAASKPVRKG